MAADDVGVARKVTPIASVWCRQVDNEAESPGYTAIPDEFPGRRETLDTIRLVGNLTINVADTHDYWDPAPTQSLSFYPNLFLYPAASGRYTCVGRMFLSTEDRPRLGMKTLVFSTAELFETADFGGTIIRAHATMDGRAAVRRPAVQPDPSVYQIVGEGFLFHRGSTEPVVVVASDQWESVCGAVLQVLRAMPSSLVALGAFLVFPYFLPASKVDMHEFAEQLPLALAVMRVPRSEAAGERHEKRIKGWADLPVTLRDLTRPLPTSRTRETLPLILQYVRDDAEQKSLEVSRRVDLVEFPRMGGSLNDAERQTGHDHRKEMWRIGTAMETAALLLSKPRGRSLPVTNETAKRANKYPRGEAGGEPDPRRAGRGRCLGNRPTRADDSLRPGSGCPVLLGRVRRDGVAGVAKGASFDRPGSGGDPRRARLDQRRPVDPHRRGSVVHLAASDGSAHTCPTSSGRGVPGDRAGRRAQPPRPLHYRCDDAADSSERDRGGTARLARLSASGAVARGARTRRIQTRNASVARHRGGGRPGRSCRARGRGTLEPDARFARPGSDRDRGPHGRLVPDRTGR